MTDETPTSEASPAPAPMTQEQAIAAVNDFRAMIDRGERPDQAAMKLALTALRAGRSAASRSTGKGKKAAAAPIDLRAAFGLEPKKPAN